MPSLRRLSPTLDEEVPHLPGAAAVRNMSQAGRGASMLHAPTRTRRRTSKHFRAGSSSGFCTCFRLAANPVQSYLARKVRILGREPQVDVGHSQSGTSYVSVTQGQKKTNFGDTVETGEPLHAGPPITQMTELGLQPRPTRPSRLFALMPISSRSLCCMRSQGGKRLLSRAERYAVSRAVRT